MVLLQPPCDLLGGRPPWCTAGGGAAGNHARHGPASPPAHLDLLFILRLQRVLSTSFFSRRHKLAWRNLCCRPRRLEHACRGSGAGGDSLRPARSSSRSGHPPSRRTCSVCDLLAGPLLLGTLCPDPASCLCSSASDAGAIDGLRERSWKARLRLYSTVSV